jgi:FkbM family methyltransferase
VSVLDAALAGIGRVIGKPIGWERIVYALAPPTRFSGADLRPTRAPCGLMFPVDRGTLIGWSVHFFGAYEPEVQAQIARWLQPGDTAIDVGANVGWHTLAMAARVGSSGRVDAFEPNPTTRARLAAMVDANRLSQVHVHAQALADREGQLGFEAPEAGHVWDGTGHLTRAASAPQSVVCATLDGFVAAERLSRVALVKIDVEGWELSVLRGGARTLAEQAPVILFEYDPAYLARSGSSEADLVASFEAADYRLVALHPRHAPTPSSRLGERAGNFLAVPSRKAGR